MQSNKGRRRPADWEAILEKERKVLRKLGVPGELTQNAEYWRDFVQHGVLHYHDAGAAFDWDIDQLASESARGLLAWLEQHLDFPERADSGLYVGLMEHLGAWGETFDAYVKWCSLACRQLAVSEPHHDLDWSRIFRADYRMSENWSTVFGRSPAMMVASHWIVPFETSGLTYVQTEIARRAVCSALEWPTRFESYDNPDYDWTAARERIKGVAAKHKFSLPWTGS